MSEYKFKAFDRVLGRMCAEDNWKIDFYVIYDPLSDYPHRCFRFDFAECIPYEGNEHFLGTNDNPAPKWEPKPGELVAVCHIATGSWAARIFSHIDENGYFVVKEWEGRNVPNQRFHICEPARKHFNIPEE